MTAQSRFLRARVVDFAGELGVDADVRAARQRAVRDRKIVAKLKRAKALRRRIRRLQKQHPANWQARVERLKGHLRAVMTELRQLGWKPTKPARPKRPGEDDADADLDALPDDTPEEAAEAPADDANDDDLADTPETGNWLDEWVGAEPRGFLDAARRLVTPKWSQAVPLGDGGRIQTRPGQRAMIVKVSPDLFVVQLVSDDAARRIAGDQVGLLPLLLFPLVKDQLQKTLGPKPAPPAATPAPAPSPTPPPSTGCDGRKGR